jgi:hypothetical protein
MRPRSSSRVTCVVTGVRGGDRVGRSLPVPVGSCLLLCPLAVSVRMAHRSSCDFATSDRSPPGAGAGLVQCSRVPVDAPRVQLLLRRSHFVPTSPKLPPGFPPARRARHGICRTAGRLIRVNLHSGPSARPTTARGSSKVWMTPPSKRRQIPHPIGDRHRYRDAVRIAICRPHETFQAHGND